MLKPDTVRLFWFSESAIDLITDITGVHKSIPTRKSDNINKCLKIYETIFYFSCLETSAASL